MTAVVEGAFAVVAVQTAACEVEAAALDGTGMVGATAGLKVGQPASPSVAVPHRLGWSKALLPLRPPSPLRLRPPFA